MLSLNGIGTNFIHYEFLIYPGKIINISRRSPVLQIHPTVWSIRIKRRHEFKGPKILPLSILFTQPKCLSVGNRVSTPFTFRLWETRHIIDFFDNSKWSDIFITKIGCERTIFFFFKKDLKFFISFEQTLENGPIQPTCFRFFPESVFILSYLRT